MDVAPNYRTKIAKGAEMARCARVLWRPFTKQEQAPRIVGAVGIVLLLSFISCRQECRKPNGASAMSRTKAAKWFLVIQHEEDYSHIEIYAIEDPSAVEKIGRWIGEHVDSSGRVQKARALLAVWQDELLRFDEHGNHFFSDILWDKDVISPGDKGDRSIY
jgi:hypothetical protein